MISIEDYEQLKKPTNKYRARRAVVDGVVFASKREAKRYTELRLLEKVGQIKHLKLQVPFRLMVKQNHVCTYTADFVYEEWTVTGEGSGYNETIVEDCKSPHLRKNPVFRLKSKLMAAIYGIGIRLT